MEIVAVTGGIASGKSTVTRGLAARLSAPWVSCDDVVNRLYGDEGVLASLRVQFGESCFPGGLFDRQALGRRVFADEEARRWLESLLHPKVLEEVERWVDAQRRENASRCGLVEVPLLYEVDFPLNRDIDVVVGCSLSTQLERIMRRDQLGEVEARRRISAQLPIEDKVIRADVVLWNDGSEAVLEQLMDLAAGRIQGIRS